MSWNDGHCWTLNLQLPVGKVEFKVVMQEEFSGYSRWETGTNRSVEVNNMGE